MSINPYKELIAAGIQTDSHESDLYVLVTPDSSRIVKASGWSRSTFVSQIDGKLWFDLPFAFEPFWDRVARVSGMVPK